MREEILNFLKECLNLLAKTYLLFLFLILEKRILKSHLIHKYIPDCLNSYHQIKEGFHGELNLIFLYSALFFVLILIFKSFLKEKKWRTVATGLFFFVAFAELSLLMYYLDTDTILDYVFFTYSFSELILIISSSTTIELFDNLKYFFSLLLTIPASYYLFKSKFNMYYFVLLVPLYYLLNFSIDSDSELQPKIRHFENACQFKIRVNGIYHLVNSTIEHNKRLSSYDLEDEAALKKAFKLYRRNRGVKIPDVAYPLLYNHQYADVLGDFLDLDSAAPPNFVFIIVESLSAEYSGPDALCSFTPYLDSLAKKSLYFPNFLSTCDRTFPVLPSAFGSLPFGFSGFSDLYEKTPNHNSLIKELKKNDRYKVNYYCGYASEFDGGRYFLENQGIDTLIDRDSYKKDHPNSEYASRTWGFPDRDVFEISLERKPIFQPFLDIYLTTTMHAPFMFPGQEKHLKMVDKIINRNVEKLDEDESEHLRSFKKELSTFLYTDESIHYFLSETSKKPEYDNTIYFIFGDHAMPELTDKNTYNWLNNYNVPLYIYSKKLKSPKEIRAINSHLNLTPTILSLLKENYEFKFSNLQTFLCSELDTTAVFVSQQMIPFIRSNTEIKDLIVGDYFLQGNENQHDKGRVFVLDSTLELNNTNTKKMSRKKMNKFKNAFTHLNYYVCEKDKLFKENRSESSLD